MFGVQGRGFGVEDWGLGFGIWVSGLGFWVQSLGIRVQGLESMPWGSGFGPQVHAFGARRQGWSAAERACRVWTVPFLPRGKLCCGVKTIFFSREGTPGFKFVEDVTARGAKT